MILRFFAKYVNLVNHLWISLLYEQKSCKVLNLLVVPFKVCLGRSKIAQEIYTKPSLKFQNPQEPQNKKNCRSAISDSTVIPNVSGNLVYTVYTLNEKYGVELPKSNKNLVCAYSLRC